MQEDVNGGRRTLTFVDLQRFSLLINSHTAPPLQRHKDLKIRMGENVAPFSNETSFHTLFPLAGALWHPQRLGVGVISVLWPSE